MIGTVTSLEIQVQCLQGSDSLQRIYQRAAPLEIEVGCGKGRFVIRCAEGMPSVNFLAIERASRYFRIALNRANRRGLTNLRLLRADGLEVVQGLSSSSVRSVHVLFPDPWPKKRHHKRRLFQPAFIDAVATALQEDGQLNVATDYTGYFEVILGLLENRTDFERRPGFALLDRLPEGESGHTNYEVKYRATGRAIHQATWTRRMRGGEPSG